MESIERSTEEQDPADIVKALRPASEDTKIEYMGSGISSFQADPTPVFRDDEGKMVPVSDWDLIVSKGEVNTKDAPHFLDKKESYIDRSAELGENMFRFSLEFGRLCPKEGEFNEELMAEYVKALALVRAHGQTPMVTVNHFTMPAFLIETDQKDNIVKGGWENPETSKHFRFYIEQVTKFLGNEDKMRGVLASEGFEKKAQDQFLAEGLANYFMSINEPALILSNGYMTGAFPPYRHGRIDLMKKVLDRMVDAHDITRDEIKKMQKGGQPEPSVGVGYNWTYFDGALSNVMQGLSEKVSDAFERDGTKTDFLGLQYYFRMTSPLLTKHREGRDYSDHPGFGDIYPPGILELLKKMNSAYPQKEIFITEMGFSDASDKRRPYWILETMRYVLEAKKQNIPVKGVLLWSLVNNLEWEFGMDQKFGLFEEADLAKPLVPGEEGITSWEAWRSVIAAIKNPTEESLGELQRCYDSAAEKYGKAKN